MQLTRAADYAVRVTMYLAALPPGDHVARSVLAAANDVPDSFLSKILQALSRAGLVMSRRGLEGGFALVPRGRQASMLEVIEAIDGPMALNVCLTSVPRCENRSWCPAHLVWAEAQEAMLRVLRRAGIAALAQSVPSRQKSRRHLPRASKPRGKISVTAPVRGGSTTPADATAASAGGGSNELPVRGSQTVCAILNPERIATRRSRSGPKTK